MAMQIEHIDAIARQKQRDALYVVFHPPAIGTPDGEEILRPSAFDWRKLSIRQQLIDWLKARNIGWKACGPIANMNVMESYRGQIFIDLPFDQSLPAFQALDAFFEFPDGTDRYPDATFYYCPLEVAMKNAAHDEPGFWDRWAETF